MELTGLDMASLGLLAILIALALPDRHIQFSVFSFFLIGVWVPLLRFSKARKVHRAGINLHLSGS